MVMIDGGFVRRSKGSPTDGAFSILLEDVRRRALPEVYFSSRLAARKNPGRLRFASRVSALPRKALKKIVTAGNNPTEIAIAKTLSAGRDPTGNRQHWSLAIHPLFRNTGWIPTLKSPIFLSNLGGTGRVRKDFARWTRSPWESTKEDCH